MNTTETKNRSRAWASEFGPVCCGRIVGTDSNRRPIVDFAGNSGEPVVARCLDTVRLGNNSSSRDCPVLLVFEHGDPAKPIIVGRVVESDTPSPNETGAVSRQAVVDGRRVLIKGDEEVTLVCGKASITLTKNGCISLRGVEIVSRASGANKIRGASVSIN